MAKRAYGLNDQKLVHTTHTLRVGSMEMAHSFLTQSTAFRSVNEMASRRKTKENSAFKHHANP